MYASTYTRNAYGRYCVQLPFREDPPILGASRDRAVSRFLQVERKLAGNQQLRKDYVDCMQEYIQLGHMQLIQTQPEIDNQITFPNGKTTFKSYYIPHHAVIKSDSTTTKLRVVFDASCKSTNGKSLNESMLIGPVLQDKLFDLLLRWRTFKIVIKADIAKMYRQIQMSSIHQPYHRIIWRNHPDDDLQEFQLQTVTFGTAAAPFLAIKTIQQLANDESAHYPIGADTLRNDFYVDDLLSGADSIQDAMEKQRQVVQILQRGGFEIRKWSSNHCEVTDQLDVSAREICGTIEATLKALGILWAPQTEPLSIKVNLPPENDSLSKRSLLSEVAKLFDPLGWIAPTIVSMKILLQRL